MATPFLSPGDLLTEVEACAAMKIAVATLRNWRWRKIGPAYLKVGPRSVRYRASDIAQFLADGERVSRDAAP